MEKWVHTWTFRRKRSTWADKINLTVTIKTYNSQPTCRLNRSILFSSHWPKNYVSSRFCFLFWVPSLFVGALFLVLEFHLTCIFWKSAGSVFEFHFIFLNFLLFFTLLIFFSKNASRQPNFEIFKQTNLHDK